MFNTVYAMKHYDKQSAYGVLFGRMAKLLSLSRQLHTNCSIFKILCLEVSSELMGKQGMIDERIALCKRVYTRICEGENGPDPVLPRRCLDWRISYRDPGGIWIEADGLQWLLTTYDHCT
jgi:hypothetical protein